MRVQFRWMGVPLVLGAGSLLSCGDSSASSSHKREVAPNVPQAESATVHLNGPLGDSPMARIYEQLLRAAGDPEASEADRGSACILIAKITDSGFVEVALSHLNDSRVVTERGVSRRDLLQAGSPDYRAYVVADAVKDWMRGFFGFCAECKEPVNWSEWILRQRGAGLSFEEMRTVLAKQHATHSFDYPDRSPGLR